MVALGVLLTPAAGLLALIGPSADEGNSCGALLKQAKGRAGGRQGQVAAAGVRLQGRVLRMPPRTRSSAAATALRPWFLA